MSYRLEFPTTCAHPGCETNHPSSRFDDSKAVSEGWFHQRDGTAWCPEHLPEWVAEWRAKQG